ncbi:hypothetical protein W824_00310 [Clavibacter cf. michiganensis LMG 26808]|nr:hypothetical protein W824_00310 [Clavibacter cf. michiganensis LMG 26808]
MAVLASRSITRSAGSSASETSTSESAMSLNEWRDPSTRIVGASRTMARSSSTLVGVRTSRARYA